MNSRSITYLGAVLFIQFAVPLFADVVPYNQDTIQKAKNEKKDILIFCGGSDWMSDYAKYLTIFKNAEKASKNSDIIWAYYDIKDQRTEEEKKIPKPPIEIWGYPALQMVDCENRPIYNKENVSLSLVGKSSALIKKIIPERQKRDELWTKAQGAKGLEKATLLGEGLDCLDWEISKTKSYSSIVNEIKAVDKEDKMGYAFKYTMNHLTIADGFVNKRLKDKKYDEANKLLDEKLKLKILTPYQRQLLLVGKYKVALSQDKFDQALAFLKTAAKIVPETIKEKEFQKGCLNQIQYYTAPVYLKRLAWTNLDNRPRWLPMIVDVSNVIKEPGKYKIEFKHRSGQTKFRNPKLSVNSNTLQQVNKEHRVFDFSLDQLPKGKIILEVESIGTGWFDGAGDIIITKQ